MSASSRKHREVLAAPFGADPGRQRLTRAVMGHAASFWTWHSLCLDHGLSDHDAVDVMASAVLATAVIPLPEGRQ